LSQSDETAGNQSAAVSRYPNAVSVGGDVIQSKLIQNVTPSYPALARAERISGVVILDVTIDEAGSVVEVRAKSGDGLLRQAAIDAVKQWKYAPTTINGNPIPVRAEVRVDFSLN